MRLSSISFNDSTDTVAALSYRWYQNGIDTTRSVVMQEQSPQLKTTREETRGECVGCSSMFPVMCVS